jgi:hypothetical protein
MFRKVIKIFSSFLQIWSRAQAFILYLSLNPHLLYVSINMLLTIQLNSLFLYDNSTATIINYRVSTNK